jgi:hypothetical protein
MDAITPKVVWHWGPAVLRLITVGTVAILALTPGLPAWSDTAGGPAIRLFPTSVLEDIKETGYVAEEMETGLQDVIARMDQQGQLYQDSKCDGADGDPGCARIAKQLGATYLEMLNVMGERLPDMERAVNATRASLEKRLRGELGQKMTSWTLQENLLGNAPSGAASPAPRMRGRSGMRLSQRFQQYYQLVASSGAGASSQSMAVVAADIYLDMNEASELIARTQEEIGRATLMEQLNQSFGTITPEMQQVVDGVKSILFGDVESPYQVAGPPPGAEDKPYRSPLEM